MRQTNQVINTHKAFSLRSDVSGSTLQKLSTVDAFLTTFQGQANQALDLIGVVGPVNAIKRVITAAHGQLNYQEQAQMDEQIDIDLSRDLNEQAAIYFVPIKGNGSKCYCIVALSTSDILYYERPFNSNTQFYVLVQYLIDMCRTLVLAYDEKIERGFDFTECPYIELGEPVHQLRVVERTLRDITFKWLPLDLEKLVAFDEKYHRSMNFHTPDRCNFLTYVNKNIHKDRRQEMLEKAMAACWERLFIHAETDEDRLLQAIGITPSESYRQLAKRLIDRELSLRQAIKGAAETCLLEAKSSYRSDSGVLSAFGSFFKSGQPSTEEFSNRICKLTIMQTFVKTNPLTLKRRNAETIREQLTMALAHEIDGEGKQPYSFYKEAFKAWVEKLVDATHKMIAESGRQFFSDVKKSLKQEFQVHEEIVEATLYQLIRDQEGSLMQIAAESESITVHDRNCNDIGIKSLSQIKDIRVFDLSTGERKSKLVWLELVEGQAVLLVAYGEQLSLVKRFLLKFQFFFSSQNRKGYLLDATTCQLSHFTIDEHDRITEEKTVSLSKQNRTVISFGVSIYPERLFYLTKERNILYSYGLREGRELQICNTTAPETGQLKYLSKGRPYDYVKCFNEQFYVVLGNNEELHILDWDEVGKPTVRQSVRLGSTFLGISILQDSYDGYLLVHDNNDSKMLALVNMSANTRLQLQSMQPKQRKGNPILEVLRQASDRFGGSIVDRRGNRKRSIVHLSNLQQEHLANYTQTLGLSDFEHYFIPFSGINQLLAHSATLLRQQLLHIVHTRTPVQICSITVTDEMDHQETRDGSARQRVKLLNFNLREHQPTERPTIVMSVIGVASAEKWYLINQLFGTRFSEISSLHGIWGCLKQANNINYLVLSTEGIFQQNVEPDTQGKLIQVLASVSDFTIVSSNSKDVIENIDSLAKADTLEDIERLCKGELFVIVRDVPTLESACVLETLERNLNRKAQTLFFTKLFKGKLNLFTMNNIRLNNAFRFDLAHLRRHLEIQGSKRPHRTFEEVLMELRIILTQFEFQDKKNFAQDIEGSKLQHVRNSILEVWRIGSHSNSRATVRIADGEVSLLESEVVLNFESLQYSNNEDLMILHRRLSEVVELARLPTSKFRSVYRQFNEFIVRFFTVRLAAAEETLANQTEKYLKSVHQDNKKRFEEKLRADLNRHFSTLRLCLNQCYTCKLVCVGRMGHESFSWQEQQLLFRKIANQEKALETLSQFSHSEESLLEYGVDKKKIDDSSCMSKLQQQLAFAEQRQNLSSKLAVYTPQFTHLTEQISELQESRSSQNLLRFKPKVMELVINVSAFQRLDGNAIIGVPLPRRMLGEITEENLQLCHTAEQCDQLNEKLEAIFDYALQLQQTVERQFREISVEQQKAIEGREKTGPLLQRLQIQLQSIRQQLQVAKSESVSTVHQLQKVEREQQASLTKLESLRKELQEISVFREKIVLQRAALPKECCQGLESLEVSAANHKEKLVAPRYSSSYDQVIRQKIERLTSIQRQLNRPISNQESLASQASFQQYERALAAELKQPSKPIPKALESKVLTWSKKLERDPTNDTYIQGKNKWQNLLKQYRERLEAVNRSRQNSIPEARLQIQKEVMTEQLRIELAQFAIIVQTIVDYDSTVLESPTNKLSQFLQVSPSCIEYEEKLTHVQPSQLGDLRSQLAAQRLAYNQAKQEFDDSDDLELIDRLEEALARMDEQLKCTVAKLSYCEFLLGGGNTKKSFFQIAKEEVLGGKHPLPEDYKFSSEEQLSRRIAELGDQLREMKETSDETEDMDYYDELEVAMEKANSERSRLLEELDITVKVKQRVTQFVQDKYQMFILKNGKERTPIEVDVDLPTETIKLYEAADQTDLEVSGAQEFFDFANGTASTGSTSDIEPLFKAIVEAYPGSFRLVAKALRTLLDSLNAINVPSVSALAESLNNKVESTIATGNVDRLSMDLLEITFGELRQRLRRQKQNIEQQLHELIISIEKEKQRLAGEEFLQSTESRYLQRESTTKKNMERTDADHKLLEQNQITLSTKLKYLLNEIEACDSNESQLAERVQRAEEQLVQVRELEQLLNIKQQRYVELMRFTTDFDEKECRSLLDGWCTEQKSNVRASTKIEELSTRAEELRRLITDSTNIHNELLGKTDGRTKATLLKEIEDLRARQLELEVLRDKLHKVDKHRSTIDALRKQLISVEKFKGQLCSCLTDHHCNQPCLMNCEGRKCYKLAGHEGSHFCEESLHRCGVKCKQQPGCQNICVEELNHPETVEHNCHYNHRCVQKCKYCEKRCCKQQQPTHETHSCNSTEKCKFQCVLCGNQCASAHHDHDDRTQIALVKSYKNGERLEPIHMKVHLCQNRHECPQLCGSKGVCSYLFKRSNRLWKGPDNIQQPYEFIQQVPQKARCVLVIPPGRLAHDNDCICSRVHSCSQRCPDCKSLCLLQYDHPQEHSTQHRQRQSPYYEEKKSNDRQLDVPSPATCYNSCKSKGRGHYHLKQCQGGQKCGEFVHKRYGTVKHSEKRYYPNPEKRYDKYLCKEYWSAEKFEMPNPHDMAEYGSCDFICQLEHDNPTKHFCKLKAWHSSDHSREAHEFDCDEQHDILTSNLNMEICFLVDATRTMGRWVKQCRAAIPKIIDTIGKANPRLSVRFAVIGYRDHPMHLSKLLHTLKSVAQRKLEQLTKLAPTQTAFTLKEYVGILTKIEKDWLANRKDLKSYLEGLSEIERLIVRYHYPFIEESNIKQEMLSVQQKTKLTNPLMSALSKKEDEKLPLTVHLINDLKQSLVNLDETILKKEELLTRFDFATGEQANRFLGGMECLGGGDSSKAVLDGMHEISKLTWSKNSFKLIFHLFDSPPHGRMYNESDDFFADGCPCGLRQETVIDRLNKLKVMYFVLPLHPSVSRAIEMFKEGGLKLQSQKRIEQPEEIVVLVTKAIATLLTPKQTPS